MARRLTLHWIRETGRALEAVLLPRRCASCHGVLTREEDEWCGPCAFSWTRCPTDPRLRFDEPDHWGHGWSWLRNGPDRLESRLVHSLKYGVRSEVGVQLGRAMAKEWTPLGIQPAHWTVVPIPLHRRKRRQRGFNQSEALARGWAEVTGMTIANVLIRPRSGQSLTQLNRHQRIRSTKDLYIPDPTLDSTWSNGLEGCLLLDDVITTGSTLASARDALSSVWKGPIGFVTLLDAIR